MSENKMELWAKQAKEWKPMEPCEAIKESD